MCCTKFVLESTESQRAGFVVVVMKDGTVVRLHTAQSWAFRNDDSDVLRCIVIKVNASTTTGCAIRRHAAKESPVFVQSSSHVKQMTQKSQSYRFFSLSNFKCAAASIESASRA